MEQTAASSPASARSANLTHVVRRRDSLTSSIGATSVRRLISVVRNSHNRPSSRYNRRVIIRYLVVFCVSHLFLNATFMPFLVLQGSVSVWTLPFHESLPISINIGSFLIAVMYALAASSTLLGPYVIHKFGANIVFLLSYAVFAVFYTVHLYPSLYLLVPAYVILGITLGQISLCYVTFLMRLSTKMSCVISEDDDELRSARRTVIVRRFARAIQASQDLGLIFGSFVTAMMIALWQQPSGSSPPETPCEGNFEMLNCSNCAQTDPCTACPYSNVSYGALTKNCSSFENLQSNMIDYISFVDNLFDVDEHGHRLCGASACASAFVIGSNSSGSDYTTVLPRTTSLMLSAVFVGFSLLSLITAGLGLGKLKTYVCQDTLESTQFVDSLRTVKESFKDVKLQLAAPLSVFIGMEQAFLYTDFSKQTAASSPASARSANLTHVVRRRDSLTSSIGATSVRRLISVVRNSHNRPSSRYNRRVIIRYLVVFCVSHLFLNATFMPFLVLQGSVSVWTLPFHESLPISINIGSFLIAVMYALAASSTLLGPYVIHKFGANIVFLLSYAVFAVFYTVHLYPSLYLLVPAYVILGITLGQISLCYVTFLMRLSTKMSCVISEDDDELRSARRTVIVRRFARAIQASQDLGLIFGSFVTAMMIALWQQPSGSSPPETPCEGNFEMLNCSNCAQTDPCTACPYSNVSYGALTKNCSSFENLQSNMIDYISFVDNLFDVDEHGHRLCGASACASAFVIGSNSSGSDYTTVLPRTTSLMLSAVFVGFSLLSLITAGLGLGKLKTYVCQDTLESTQFVDSLRTVKESFKDVKLQLAAPLSVFIGMEQAFLYTDFSKVCIH